MTAHVFESLGEGTPAGSAHSGAGQGLHHHREHGPLTGESGGRVSPGTLLLPCPLGPRQSMENLTAQTVSRGHPGVVAIVAGIVTHAQFLHHPSGASVAGAGEGHDLENIKLKETVSQSRPRSLGRITMAPVLPGQPPPHLHRGSEGGAELDAIESDESGKIRRGRDLDNPQTPTPGP